MRKKMFLRAFPFAAPTIVTSGTELVDLVQALTNWFFVGFLLAAVVFVIIAAFQFLTGGGDPVSLGSAKKKLIWAVVAIIIAVLARTIPLVVENIITGTAPPAGLPAPILVSPANGATGLSTTPTLTWSSVPGAVAYAANILGVNTGIVTGTSFTVPAAWGLTTGTTYSWSVRACPEAACTTPTLWSVTRIFTVGAAAAADTTPPAFISPTCVESDCSPTYSTPDTTPLFLSTTDENASCRYSSADLSYDSMFFNCEAGQGTTSHDCNGDFGGLTFPVGPWNVFISCQDTAPTPNKNTSANNLDIPFTVIP